MPVLRSVGVAKVFRAPPSAASVAISGVTGWLIVAVDVDMDELLVRVRIDGGDIGTVLDVEAIVGCWTSSSSRTRLLTLLDVFHLSIPAAISPQQAHLLCLDMVGPLQLYHFVHAAFPGLRTEPFHAFVLRGQPHNISLCFACFYPFAQTIRC